MRPVVLALPQKGKAKLERAADGQGYSDGKPEPTLQAGPAGCSSCAFRS